MTTKQTMSSPTIDVEPKKLTTQEVHHYLLGGIGPRPIALVSTVSRDGTRNLSPFSFFNAFGANPPIVAFSPSRKGRDATLKDTYNNIVETNECVIQAVTHAMVHQISLASCQFPPDVDEFSKSGLTPIPSDIVRPDRVAESPFQMECILKQMIPLGDKGASGNLAICEVVKFHIDESVTRIGKIEPDLIDLVGRMGGNWYARAQGEMLFEVDKPGVNLSIGIDQLPEFIRRSGRYTQGQLAQLATIDTLPSMAQVEQFCKKFINQKQKAHLEHELTLTAAFEAIDTGEIDRAVILADRAALQAIHNSEINYAIIAALKAGVLAGEVW